MRVCFTGGGTGGHIYPALEVALHGRDQGADVFYLGSLRGQEGSICQRNSIPFTGFPSQPLFSLKTPRGWKALGALLRSRQMALKALASARPDAVFCTGGYSAGPVIGAASKLGIPFVIHEQNSVPGRSNLLWAKNAHIFAYVFHSTKEHLGGLASKRTGMPIRRTLREQATASRGSAKNKGQVLVVGGSLGSDFLNTTIPLVAEKLKGEQVQFLHSAGKGNDQAVNEKVSALGLENYKVVPYFEAAEMARAYAESELVIGRSGGTLAELALFELPSVLIPLPIAAKDHQTVNAKEFASFGGAKWFAQPQATPEVLAGAVTEWLSNPEAMEHAREGLRSFDAPHATIDLWSCLEQAAQKK